MALSLRTHVEIWHRYGAYLSGVAGISKANPSATFEQFMGVCGSNTGAWSREALMNAWNSGRK